MPRSPSSPTSQSNPATTLRMAELSTRKPTRFALEPDETALARLKQELDLQDLRKLRFAGILEPTVGKDWRLEAELGATVVQPCSVTLAPVTTRIDETVTRHYRADWHDPEGAEVEMPEEDNAGPIPEVVDLMALMVEELALLLPLYPRAEGASLGAAVFTEPGKAPMTDTDAKPFAALQKLRVVGKPEES